MIACKPIRTHTPILTHSFRLFTKERVEEDRYMRKQEEAWKEKLRAIRQQEHVDEEERIHAEVIVPVMNEISNAILTDKDRISSAGLERLAKWKLNILDE